MSRAPSIQSSHELDRFYATPDPWRYASHPDDALRKRRLLSLIPPRRYERTLDIGCGDGFLTFDLPGDEVLGCDLSAAAIGHAERAARERGSERHRFCTRSIFDLHPEQDGTFDLVTITGVLYPQYIGRSMSLVHLIVDGLLRSGGVLIHCHIADWFERGFPYQLIDRSFYAYREYTHRLEVYRK